MTTRYGYFDDKQYARQLKIPTSLQGQKRVQNDIMTGIVPTNPSLMFSNGLANTFSSPHLYIHSAVANGADSVLRRNFDFEGGLNVADVSQRAFEKGGHGLVPESYFTHTNPSPSAIFDDIAALRREGGPKLRETRDGRGEVTVKRARLNADDPLIVVVDRNGNANNVQQPSNFPSTSSPSQMPTPALAPTTAPTPATVPAQTPAQTQATAQAQGQTPAPAPTTVPAQGQTPAPAPTTVPAQAQIKPDPNVVKTESVDSAFTALKENYQNATKQVKYKLKILSELKAAEPKHTLVKNLKTQRAEMDENMTTVEKMRREKATNHEVLKAIEATTNVIAKTLEQRPHGAGLKALLKEDKLKADKPKANKLKADPAAQAANKNPPIRKSPRIIAQNTNGNKKTSAPGKSTPKKNPQVKVTAKAQSTGKAAPTQSKAAAKVAANAQAPGKAAPKKNPPTPTNGPLTPKTNGNKKTQKGTSTPSKTSQVSMRTPKNKKKKPTATPTSTPRRKGNRKKKNRRKNILKGSSK